MLNARLVDEAVNKSGGEKKRLQRMVLNGQIDQLTATLAAMRIDRIQNAAKLDQLNQPTVAEQVLNPQPQMQQPQAMMAAKGGGLDSIDYVEGDYAAGGIVSFNQGGGAYQAQIAALTQVLNDPRTSASDREKAKLKLNEVSMKAKLEQQTLAAQDLVRGEADSVLPGVDQDVAGLAGQRAPQPQAPIFDAGAAAEEARQARVAAVEGTERPQGTKPSLFGLTAEDLPRVGDVSGFTDSMGKGLAAMIAAQEGTGETPIDRSGRRVTFESPDPTADPLVLGETQAEIDARGNPLDPTGLISGRKTSEKFRSLVDLLPNVGAYRGPQMGPGRTQEQVAPTAVEAVAAGEDISTGGRRITDPAEIARMKALTEGQQDLSGQFVEQKEGDQFGSVTDQVTQTEEAAKTIAGEQKTTGTTTTKGDTTAAAASENAGVQELENAGVKGDTLSTISSLADMFKNEEGPAAKRYREYLQNLPKQAGQRKSDALAMFALQTGIGMLAQPGGQTALQAAGKSANAAMKTYVEEMRDIRGLEEKALKGEVALEELQQKRSDANLKIAADIYGRQIVADTSLAAARINAGKPTDATRGINRIAASIREKIKTGEFSPMSPAQINAKAQEDYYSMLAAVQTAKLAQSGVTDQVAIMDSINNSASAMANDRMAAWEKDIKNMKATGAERDAQWQKYYLDARKNFAKQYEPYLQSLSQQGSNQSSQSNVVQWDAFGN